MSRVIIALTKADLDSALLVDADVVIRSITSFFKSIGVKCEAIVRTSASSGDGIVELLTAVRSCQTSAVVDERGPPPSAREFACRFRILFIPEGRVLSVGSTFAVHSSGEEATAVLERISGQERITVVRPGVDYIGKFSLDRSIPIANRIILRLPEATIGFCKNAKAPRKRIFKAATM